MSEEIRQARKEWFDDKEKADVEFQTELNKIRPFINDAKLEPVKRDYYLRQRDVLRKKYERARMDGMNSFMQKMIQIKGKK